MWGFYDTGIQNLVWCYDKYYTVNVTHERHSTGQSNKKFQLK